MAIALHNDAVTEDPDERDKVIFRQYDGVSPKAYMKLFMPVAPRKKAGSVSRPDPASALPVLRMLLDAQVDYESKVIDDLGKKEHAPTSPSPTGG